MDDSRVRFLICVCELVSKISCYLIVSSVYEDVCLSFLIASFAYQSVLSICAINFCVSSLHELKESMNSDRA